MGWIAESKEITQKYYSGYCQMSRAIEEEILPYHQFTMEIYNKTKEALNKKKLNDSQGT